MLRTGLLREALELGDDGASSPELSVLPGGGADAVTLQGGSRVFRVRGPFPVWPGPSEEDDATLDAWRNLSLSKRSVAAPRGPADVAIEACDSPAHALTPLGERPDADAPAPHEHEPLVWSGAAVPDEALTPSSAPGAPSAAHPAAQNRGVDRRVDGPADWDATRVGVRSALPASALPDSPCRTLTARGSDTPAHLPTSHRPRDAGRGAADDWSSGERFGDAVADDWRSADSLGADHSRNELSGGRSGVDRMTDDRPRNAGFDHDRAAHGWCSGHRRRNDRLNGMRNRAAECMSDTPPRGGRGDCNRSRNGRPAEGNARDGRPRSIRASDDPRQKPDDGFRLLAETIERLRLGPRSPAQRPAASAAAPDIPPMAAPAHLPDVAANPASRVMADSVADLGTSQLTRAGRESDRPASSRVPWPMPNREAPVVTTAQDETTAPSAPTGGSCGALGDAAPPLASAVGPASPRRAAAQTRPPEQSVADWLRTLRAAYSDAPAAAPASSDGRDADAWRAPSLAANRAGRPPAHRPVNAGSPMPAPNAVVAPSALGFADDEPRDTTSAPARARAGKGAGPAATAGGTCEPSPTARPGPMPFASTAAPLAAASRCARFNDDWAVVGPPACGSSTDISRFSNALSDGRGSFAGPPTCDLTANSAHASRAPLADARVCGLTANVAASVSASDGLDVAVENLARLVGTALAGAAQKSDLTRLEAMLDVLQVNIDAGRHTGGRGVAAEPARCEASLHTIPRRCGPLQRNAARGTPAAGAVKPVADADKEAQNAPANNARADLTSADSALEWMAAPPAEPVRRRRSLPVIPRSSGAARTAAPAGPIARAMNEVAEVETFAVDGADAHHGTAAHEATATPGYAITPAQNAEAPRRLDGRTESALAVASASASASASAPSAGRTMPRTAINAEGPARAADHEPHPVVRRTPRRLWR